MVGASKNGRRLKGNKGKVAHEPQEAHAARAYPGFCSKKQLRVLLLFPWMGC